MAPDKRIENGLALFDACDLIFHRTAISGNAGFGLGDLLFALVKCDSVTRTLHLKADHDQRYGQPGDSTESGNGHHSDL